MRRNLPKVIHGRGLEAQLEPMLSRAILNCLPQTGKMEDGCHFFFSLSRPYPLAFVDPPYSKTTQLVTQTFALLGTCGALGLSGCWLTLHGSYND